MIAEVDRYTAGIHQEMSLVEFAQWNQCVVPVSFIGPTENIGKMLERLKSESFIRGPLCSFPSFFLLFFIFRLFLSFLCYQLYAHVNNFEVDFRLW